MTRELPTHKCGGLVFCIIYKMKVAVDISPLKAGHSVRGIGTYTRYLTEEFKTGKWGIDFEFFTDPASPPPADLIHYPYFDLFFHTLKIPKNTPCVVTIHDVIPLVFPHYFPIGIRGFFNLMGQKRSLLNAAAVICDSQSSKRDIIDKLSLPPAKIHVVYLAPAPIFRVLDYSTKELISVAKKYHLPPQFVLYVGDINWNKNLKNLLEAVKIARVNLVMVGQAVCDPNLREAQQINLLVKKLGLGDKVTKTGYVSESELAAIYHLARLTLQPSYYEGFGLPVLESMACGTPVVASNAASLAEIAGPAVFCDPADPADIAAKIKSVLNLSPKARASLAKKGLIHAKKFTWRQTAQQTIKVYKSVAQ